MLRDLVQSFTGRLHDVTKSSRLLLTNCVALTHITKLIVDWIQEGVKLSYSGTEISSGNKESGKASRKFK